MTTLTTARVQTNAALSSRLLPALSAVLLGMLILYGVGFAQMPAAHNAAHDTRHSAAFPCH
ncbi:MAG TPA: CbtB domain-containing protein [Candidatus Competibacteraceae bacterium]|nr:CbtB domain-containing protein [Candidatus Competibacteraceae bacterium]